jgi:hypothetical protein
MWRVEHQQAEPQAKWKAVLPLATGIGPPAISGWRDQTKRLG